MQIARDAKRQTGREENLIGHYEGIFSSNLLEIKNFKRKIIFMQN